jgi:hypothetical protein
VPRKELIFGVGQFQRIKNDYPAHITSSMKRSLAKLQAVAADTVEITKILEYLVWYRERFFMKYAARASTLLLGGLLAMTLPCVRAAGQGGGHGGSGGHGSGGHAGHARLSLAVF